MPFLSLPAPAPPCGHNGAEITAIEYRFDYDTPFGPTFDHASWARNPDDPCSPASIEICVDALGVLGPPCQTEAGLCIEGTGPGNFFLSAISFGLSEGRFGGEFLVTARIEETGWFQFGRGWPFLATDMRLIVGDRVSCLEPTGPAPEGHLGVVAKRWLEAGEVQVSITMPEPITVDPTCPTDGWWSRGGPLSMTGGFWAWDWNQVDLHELLAQWGECGHYDLDADGVVGARDLGLLLSRMR